jgi:hypothetical protein
LTNTVQLIKYCDSQIASELETLLKANQEQFQHSDLKINIYNDSIYFLKENEPNDNTEWEHEQFEILVRGIRDVKTLAALNFMNDKLGVLRDRIIYKNEQV